jgi:hypothetical protein
MKGGWGGECSNLLPEGGNAEIIVLGGIIRQSFKLFRRLITCM